MPTVASTGPCPTAKYPHASEEWKYLLQAHFKTLLSLLPRTKQVAFSWHVNRCKWKNGFSNIHLLSIKFQSLPSEHTHGKNPLFCPCQLCKRRKQQEAENYTKITLFNQIAPWASSSSYWLRHRSQQTMYGMRLKGGSRWKSLSTTHPWENR